MVANAAELAEGFRAATRQLSAEEEPRIDVDALDALIARVQDLGYPPQPADDLAERVDDSRLTTACRQLSELVAGLDGAEQDAGVRAVLDEAAELLSGLDLAR